jgi:hypothetical protein
MGRERQNSIVYLLSFMLIIPGDGNGAEAIHDGFRPIYHGAIEFVSGF